MFYGLCVAEAGFMLEYPESKIEEKKTGDTCLPYVVHLVASWTYSSVGKDNREERFPLADIELPSSCLSSGLLYVIFSCGEWLVEGKDMSHEDRDAAFP